MTHAPAFTLTVHELEAIVEAASERGAARALAHLRDSDWLTAKDAAAHLGLALCTVREHARTGKLPAHRTGKLLRFRRSELDAWVRSAAE